jgi:DNA-binding NarL/FixJ family response regulator
MSTSYGETHSKSALQSHVHALRDYQRNQASKTGYLTVCGDSRPGRCGVSSLSAREWRVVQGVAAGLTNAEIAPLLDTTEYVVKNYLRVIYDKMGFYNRVELALWYVKYQREH